MGQYACRCSRDEDDRLPDGQHKDQCPAGELQDWAGRMLEYERTKGESAMNGYEFRGFHIRADMIDAIRQYIDHRIDPGHFLTAVIENDLREAVMRADDDNLANIPAFVAYFYNEAPMTCWGSPEHRREWLAHAREAEPDS